MISPPGDGVQAARPDVYRRSACRASPALILSPQSVFDVLARQPERTFTLFGIRAAGLVWSTAETNVIHVQGRTAARRTESVNPAVQDLNKLSPGWKGSEELGGVYHRDGLCFR